MMRNRIDPEGFWAAAMLAVLGTAGLFYVNIAAALVDGLEHSLHFSPRQAGEVVAANVLGAAVGAFAASFFVRRIAWRPAALVLLLGLMAIDAAANFVITPGGLELLRLLDGLLGGFLVSTSYSVFARTRRPDRVFGLLLVVQFGMGGLATMALVRLVAIAGIWVDWAALMAFSAVALALLAFIPDYARHAEAPGVARAPVPWLLCLGLLLFQAANMGLAANLVRFGMGMGISRNWVAGIAGAAIWFGIPGAMLPVALPARLGRLRPLIVAYVLAGLGLALFLVPNAGFGFALAAALVSVTWSMAIAYMLGMAAALDRSGRGAALAGFASKLGLAAGPYAAGRVLEFSGSFTPLLAMSLVAMAASAAVVLPVVRGGARIAR